MTYAQPFTAQEQQTLLRIARRTIEAVTSGHAFEPEGTPSQRLEQNAGAFVTLYRGGQLRGCVGTFDTTQSVVSTVIEMAEAAALRDRRFEVVRPEEVPELEISISVLEPPKPIDSVAQIEVGRHGLIVSRSVCRGVLLGKVAVERRWAREEFLAQTCVKAGLPPEDWRTIGKPGGIEVATFEAIDFGERDHG